MRVTLDKNPLDTAIWSQSRDYRGLDFRDYLTPNFYRAVQSDDRFGLSDFLNLQSNNQVFVINQPNPGRTALFSRSEIREGQQSPEAPIGIYRKDARFSVFYWVGSKQISQQFKLVNLNKLQFEQLAPNEETTIIQDALLRASEYFPSFPRFDDTRRLGSILNDILDVFDYGNVIAVWVPDFIVQEDLSAVTGSSPSLSVLDSVSVQKDRERSFLPFLVSGFGLATGSPLLIGSGFVLRYLESVRK